MMRDKARVFGFPEYNFDRRTNRKMPGYWEETGRRRIQIVSRSVIDYILGDAVVGAVHLAGENFRL